MSFKAFYLEPGGEVRGNLSEADIKRYYDSKQGLLWVDVCGSASEDGEFLARNFSFHHLAIEDCISTAIHSPKIDDFGDHLFIIVHGVNHASESDLVETTELALFLGHHFVVSFHNYPMYSIQSSVARVEDDGRPMRRGPDFLVHTLLDGLIDNVLPTIDKMNDVADQVEEEVIHDPSQSTLETILKLKRSALRIRRVMTPQREVLNRLSRREFSLISPEAEIFYRDVYDHIVRIEDHTQSLRDRSDSALATHLSSVANRQNETMRVLSIVATIFLPLALLAGVYGMNFEYMPELGWRWGYFAVIGFMGAAITGLISFFWAQRWLTWGRRQVGRVRLFTVEPERLLGHLGGLGRKRSAGEAGVQFETHIEAADRLSSRSEK